MISLEQFHFLRPAWLLALPALGLLVWLLRDSLSAHSAWRKVIDPALLPHLTAGPSGLGSSRRIVILALVASVLISLALAGPSWRQLPQPVYDSPLHRVLVMDLSAAMNAADIKPSRLARSKLLAQQLLNNQDEGDTALVAFAADAFSVVPLTSDRNTVSHLLSSLSTDLMPSPGDNLAAGIDEARRLLEQGGASRGDIVVLTATTPDAKAKQASEDARAQGFRVHVLAAGTEQGAPIPAPGGSWQRNRQGGIELARLSPAALAELARRGGGQYRRVDQAGADFRLPQHSVLNSSASASDDRFEADQWQDEGPWLLIPLILICAVAFRRGWLFMLVLCSPLLTYEAHAGWWQTQDQQALEHFQAGDFEQAAKQFERRDWQASAHYKAGDFAKAAELWASGDSASDAYNQGNALARAGELEAAIEAYSEALQRDPGLSEAQANRDLLEQLLQQQKQQQQQQQQQQDGQQGDNGEPQDEQSGSSEQDQSNEQNSSPNDAQQQPSDGQQQDDASRSEQSAEQAQEANEQAAEQAADEHNAAAQDPAQADEAQAQLGEFDPDDEQAQAVQQWLKRIPDDPGGLLRRKFERMQQRRQTN